MRPRAPSAIWSSSSLRSGHGRKSLTAPGSFPETRFLHLDSTKARTLLGWIPPLSFADTVELTASWYRDYAASPEKASQITARQIEQYREAVRNHAGR